MKHIFRIKRHPWGSNFIAINLCGFIFSVQRLSTRSLRHEYIHSRQQREMLYLPFFVWYLTEWMVRWLMYGDRFKAYRNISFEREAYIQESDEHYLEHRHAYAWLRFLRRERG